MCELISIGISLMNIVNKIGPSTLPWGMPETTLVQSEYVVLITTLCSLFDRKSLYKTTIYFFSILAAEKQIAPAKTQAENCSGNIN